MKFFIVTFVHRNLKDWRTHLDAHLVYLRTLVANDRLRASGPLKGTAETERGAVHALLILQGESGEDIVRIIDEDPFTIHGLIEDLTITEWDPLFGDYESQSSGNKTPPDAI